ncbi:MAG: zinc ribbon domain-containing protein [Chromatiaceae bacterium]|nr:zinc ribbon domain-containing protein [Chromatiaceae bacterium]
MPFYEYRCGSCGHEFEAMQKMSAAPLTDCPACAAADLTKLVSVAGFHLKGGGWYETDFKGRRSLWNPRVANRPAATHAAPGAAVAADSTGLENTLSTGAPRVGAPRHFQPGKTPCAAIIAVK